MVRRALVAAVCSILSASAVFAQENRQTPFAFDKINYAVQADDTAKAQNGAGKKVADTKFWVMTGMMIGATVYDVESTYFALNHCPPGKKCSEGNPMMRPFINPGRFSAYSIQGSIAVVEGYLSYRLKKKGNKFWLFPPLAISAAHFWAGTWNMSVAFSF